MIHLLVELLESVGVSFGFFRLFEYLSFNTLLAALTALLFLPGPWRRGRLPDPAVTGLLALSLPATMILDLVCGYPLRLAATFDAA